MTKLVRFAAVGAVAATMLLTGCVAAPTTSSPTSPGTAASDSSPAPSPARPALSQLIVSPNGISDLTIGQPVPSQATATAIVKYDPTACLASDGTAKPGEPYAGGWFPRYPAEDSPVGSRVPFTLMTADGLQGGNLAFVVVWGSGPKTASGIGVGSAVADVTQAFPGASVIHGLSTDIYVVDGEHGQLAIEVASRAVDGDTPWGAGSLGKVVWMQIVDKSTHVSSIANTDVGGSCSS